MKNDRICNLCEAPLDSSLHGNRRHCDHDCYKVNMNIRSNDNYRRQKANIKAFTGVDNLLKQFYQLFGADCFIQAILLDSAGMDWSISQKELTIEGYKAKQIIQYAYCLFTNETVKIWKL